MSEHFLDHIFKGSDLVYFKGPARLVDETGVFGIRLNERGRSFIMKLKQLYMSGDIFKLKRWDDSYAIMKLRTNMNIGTKDLVPKNCKTSKVIEHSLFKDYITHNKGLHGRILGIMK